MTLQKPLHVQEKYRQKIFSTFDDALGHLDREFFTIDSDFANSESEFPLARDRKHYYELEQRLKKESKTASLWEALDFFIAHHKKKKFVPQTVMECMDKFIASRLGFYIPRHRFLRCFDGITLKGWLHFMSLLDPRAWQSTLS